MLGKWNLFSNKVKVKKELSCCLTKLSFALVTNASPFQGCDWILYDAAQYFRQNDCRISLRAAMHISSCTPTRKRQIVKFVGYCWIVSSVWTLLRVTLFVKKDVCAVGPSCVEDSGVPLEGECSGVQERASCSVPVCPVWSVSQPKALVASECCYRHCSGCLVLQDPPF